MYLISLSLVRSCSLHLLGSHHWISECDLDVVLWVVI